MVFGMNKKERRVPDLSRYDYHYQNRDDFNKSPRLSAAAAHAASVGAYTPGVSRSQAQRSHSMTHSSSQAIRRGSVNRGPSRVPKSASSNYRSYSLRSQSSAQPRRDSLTSNSSAARPRNGNGSRSNSITVKTTEVRDAQGRTQSITRRTIRRANGYEYVETTTTTTQAIPVLDAEKHFDEFSGNYILQDDGIEELSEEEQPGGDQQRGHAYAALTAKMAPPNGLLSGGADGEVPLDQTSSISQFSDALEYVPDRSNKQKKRPVKTNRRPASQAASGQKAKEPRRQQPKRSLTEKEMYAKAYAIAQQNVYKSNDVSRNGGATAGQSRMGQRTLRGPAPADSESVTSGGSSAKQRTKPNRISSFFQRNGNNQTEGTEDIPQSAAPVADKQNFEEPRISVPKSPLPKAPVITSKQKMSDEEMYRQALAIAQEKYGQNQTPVPTKATSAVDQELVNVPATSNVEKEPEEPLPHAPSAPLPTEPVQRSNSDVEEQDSDMFERPEATTATKTTTPEANGGTQVDEWDRYDIAHPEPTNKDGATEERKSKFKNMFEKVKQFSIENSGYQQPKAASKKTPAVKTTTIEEINIVQVPPIDRSNSTSSHGASTTRNVQEPLEPQNRHFNDQASDTSFHKSLKKKTTVEEPPSQPPATKDHGVATTKKTKANFFKKLFSRSSNN